MIEFMSKARDFYPLQKKNIKIKMWALSMGKNFFTTQKSQQLIYDNCIKKGDPKNGRCKRWSGWK